MCHQNDQIPPSPTSVASQNGPMCSSCDTSPNHVKLVGIIQKLLGNDGQTGCFLEITCGVLWNFGTWELQNMCCSNKRLLQMDGRIHNNPQEICRRPRSLKIKRDENDSKGRQNDRFCNTKVGARRGRYDTHTAQHIATPRAVLNAGGGRNK